MTENSDRNTYDSDTRMDELLNSFIDGELTGGKQTEVEELVARDGRAAQRLRQLRQCKALLGSLPRAEAPSTVLEGVKASLAATALPAEEPALDEQARKPYPRVRRVLAAAAMIGLAAVLVSVMHTFVSPEAPSDQTFVSQTIKATQPSVGTVVQREFSGRLELRTNDLVAVSASINKAIEGINASEATTPARRQDSRIYTLACSKEDLDALLADLEPVWPQLDSAVLSVNTGVFGKQVVVDAVTTEQIAQIIDQGDPAKRIEMAKDFAALNDMALRLPGRAVANAIEGRNDYLVHQWRVPKPALAERERPNRKAPSQAEDKDTVHLTIVVSW
ncbi:MAG: hypothetical protein P8Z79_00820 [Sedimentisphaerales bacterium]|jgi:hypothetical protein